MILTTSKRPSGRTRTFAREIASVMPNVHYIQRGKKSMEEMAGDAFYAGHERLCIVKTRNGNPCGFEFMDTETKEYIGGMDFSVTLRREMRAGRTEPPPEDLEFLLISRENDAPLLATLLEARATEEREDASCVAIWKDERIDFFRFDMDEEPMGPRLFVRNVYGKNHYHH